MFDGGVVNDVDGETVASYELEWKAIHQTLCNLARRRVELEAEEGTYLLEAEDLRVFKRLGYRSMVEYMVGELGFTRHVANERLRVSRELLALPKLAAAYRAGELCFSKVRELTRVVTPTTEEAFLVEAAGKDSHQVAKMVSGLRRGDRPDAVPNPALVTTRVVFELHAEAASLLAWRTRGLKAQLGRAPTNDELFVALCTSDVPAADRRSERGARDVSAWDRSEPADRACDSVNSNDSGSTGDCAAVVVRGGAHNPTGDGAAEIVRGGAHNPTGHGAAVVVRGGAHNPTGDCAAGVVRGGAHDHAGDGGAKRSGDNSGATRAKGGAVPPPGARQLFVTCKHCDRSELIVDGQALAIDRATAERLSCDAEIIGDADSDERTRVTSKIPAALRRKVFMRDKFRCVVPGCTAREHLDAHHLEHLEHGGTHTMSNLCVLCFHHHKAHHDGVLEISGVAPHRLEFRWRRDADEDATN